MTLNDAALALAAVLRAENEALAMGDATEAGRLLAAKQSAVVALQAALPDGRVDAPMAAELQALAQRNRVLLAQAIEVQSRIVEMVARAARAASAGPARYGARGAAYAETGAIAVTFRA